MSKLAESLAGIDLDVRVRRGPTGACDVYGSGDLDDWREVERIRRATSWAIAQATVDETLGIESIDEDKFRYHWRGKCWHWTTEQRAEIKAGL